MKKSRILILSRFACLAMWLASLAPLSPAQAQHAHINAGALSRDPQSALLFLNGDAFVTNSGFVLNLGLTNQGAYAGHYQGSITFTALPATSANGGPAFGHANPGSHLELEITSVAGPAGGSFGFWEETDAAPRFSVRVGETNSSARFPLSENDSSPDADPYGHIHGRRFTTTLPGLYTVGFRIIDTSQNGPGNQPLHAPSALFPMFFQSGITIHSLEASPAGTRVVFGGIPRLKLLLETTARLDAPDWTTVAGPIATTNRITELIDPAQKSPSSAPTRFYRLRADPSP